MTVGEAVPRIGEQFFAGRFARRRVQGGVVDGQVAVVLVVALLLQHAGDVGVAEPAPVVGLDAVDGARDLDLVLQTVGEQVAALLLVAPMRPHCKHAHKTVATT